MSTTASVGALVSSLAKHEWYVITMYEFIACFRQLRTSTIISHDQQKLLVQSHYSYY